MTPSELQQLFRDDPMLERAALVAEMYYIYHLPQKKIAQQLGISRPWVSKLLKRAEEAGIVTIRVETAWAGIQNLEEELLKAFPLKGAKVTASGGSNDESLRHAARACSHYLVSLLQPHQVVALSWGYTLGAVAQQFVAADLSQNLFVPLVGGMGDNSKILSNSIVETIAKRTGADYHLLHLPAFVAGREQKEALLADEQVQQVIHLAEQADLLLCSVGALHGSTMSRNGYLSPVELEELAALGAVGDIALQFIDREGQLVSHPIQDRIVSGDFQKLRQHHPLSLALVVGQEKIPILHAALKGKFIDVLVVDENTAMGLLEQL